MVNTGAAFWKAEDKALPLHKDTTVTLTFTGSGIEKAKSGTLWLLAVNSREIILPETVTAQQGKAQVPVFLRGENPQILVHDSNADETTTLTIPTIAPSGKMSWLPILHLSGIDEQPIVIVNQEVTPTLTLAGGDGEMPPSVHVTAEDHRGRLVFSRFFSTFDMLGGLATLKLPAAGYYDLRVKLVDDDITSLPRSTHPERVPVPFGTWVERAKPSDVAKADYITTDVVVGSIVALEHLPTTATVLLEDRISVAVFGQHSRENRLNRWPYMINGAGVQDLPIRQFNSRGTKLLQLQKLLGSTFGPIAVKWSDLQFAPGSYRWASLVDLLPLYRKNQVRPIVRVYGKSALSKSLPTETTETLASWQQFSYQLSHNFGKLIWGLEIGGGPSPWIDETSATEYARLLQTTWTGYSTRDGERIQAAPILANISSSKGIEFELLRKLLKSEAKDGIGGISFELYPEKPDASPHENGFESSFDQLKAALEEAGKESLPVWLMKTGWANGPGGVTQDLQANYMVKVHTLALVRGFYKVGWDGLTDKSAVPWEKDAAKRRGLLTADLKPKLSGVAYNVMSYLMSGLTPRETSRQGSARIFAFNIGLQTNKWPGLLYVAWTESPQETQEVLLNMTQGGGVYALDYLGAEIPAEKVEANPDSPLKGTFRIPVGFEPVFIWDAGKPGNSSTPPTQ